jgi:outer membrane protein assembly factor BamB
VIDQRQTSPTHAIMRALALLALGVDCSPDPSPAFGAATAVRTDPCSSMLADASAEGTDAANAGGFALVPNSENVLAQHACVDMPGAFLARVRSSDGEQSLETPYSSLRPDGVGAISVLGLAPSTAYSFSLETLQASGATVGGTLSGTTPALPTKLAAFRIATTGSPSSASRYYLVSGAGPYSAAFDRAGTFRWYHGFDAQTQESKMHADGTFTTYVGTSTGAERAAGQYIRYTPDGALVATYSAVTPDTSDPTSPTVYTDPHELLITTTDEGEERIHLMGYAVLPRSSSDSTLAAWHQLQRLKPDGTLEFLWKTSDHFTADDQTLVGPSDVDHTNAIAIDPDDGNYVLSIRNLDALVKINYTTGDVIWQLGGKKSSFELAGDPLEGFQGQHSVRILPKGGILLFDNGRGHSPPESRAVEYRLDTASMTATMVWQFRHSPAVYTPVTGSVERLSNGNTLVAFAFAGVVDEVDTSGQLLWEAQLFNGANAAVTYRVRSLPSLYGFQNP